MSAAEPCPCGTGERFGQCCLPLLAGERQAETAEALVRSRYSAYVTDAVDYVWRTWHPRTRPPPESLRGTRVWTGLTILDVVAGRPGDEHGEVEFQAFHRGAGEHVVQTLHERSRFEVRAHRWFYVDGVLQSVTSRPRPGRGPGR